MTANVEFVAHAGRRPRTGDPDWVGRGQALLPQSDRALVGLEHR